MQSFRYISTGVKFQWVFQERETLQLQLLWTLT